MSASADSAFAAPPSIGEPRAAVPPAATEPWPFAVRVGFRFAFAYWILFIIPWPLADWIPPTWSLYSAGFNRVMPWIGHHLLGITRDIPIAETGSGDRTVDWINLGLCFSLALVIAAAWSLADRRRTRYDRWYEALRILVRYCLASMMFGYGIIKLFKGQFTAPPPFRLLETYGDSSPMGLLWTFMGHSGPYIIFSGAGETLGAALLCVRRTTTLGALVLIAVLTNVVMLNLCYDVAVKIGSGSDLLMALFLVIPDARRLANVLVLQRPALPNAKALVLPRRWMRVGRVVAKIAIIGFMLFSSITRARENQRFGFTAQTFLDGVWDIQGLVRNGAAAPLTLTDDKSWRRVIFVLDRMLIWRMDGSHDISYEKSEDEPRRELRLTPLDDKDRPIADRHFVLTQTRADHDHVTLAGTLGGDTIELRLRRLETSKMRLKTRGFHWISEEPYNR